MTPSRARVLFGTDEPVPDTTELRAGPLSLALRAGRLWHLRAGGAEIWHGVAFLYRDGGWGTPEPVLVRRRAIIAPRSFRIRLGGYFPTTPRIDFTLDFEGTRDGVVRVSGEAVPRGDIEANRLGLCVMHSMGLARRRVEVRHVDARTSRSTFPDLIPAWPPFMLVRAIRHEYAPGRFASSTFEGDDFELEDQRNNSDPSFKTYSRSNMMPRPYVLRGGMAVRQAVELVVSTRAPRARALRDEPIRVQVQRKTHALPSIGVEIATSDTRADAALRAALHALRPGHLHLSIGPDPAAVDFRGLHHLLEAAGARLRLDVTLDDVPQSRRELERLRHALERAGIVPESVAVFATDPRSVDAARRAFPRATIGGGTPHFFVQLNRAEDLGNVDFLTFTTCPIVHSADDESVMATLRSLPAMCRTLRTRVPGTRIRIGPSSIAARASPLGRQPESDGTRRIPLAQRDPRCRGLFGAAWLVGYVAQLATSDVDAITLMSLTGASGIASRRPGRVAGRWPSFHALQCLQDVTHVREVRVSDPSRLAALALRRNGTRELLLANLTGLTTDVVLPDGAHTVCVLDARSWRGDPLTADAWRSIAPARRAATCRITLDAYAVARVSPASVRSR